MNRLLSQGLRVLIAALLLSFPAAAQFPGKPEDDPDQRPRPPFFPKREAPTRAKQVMLNADTVEYDRTSEVVTATGNIEISQNDRVLLADKVVYDRRNDEIFATGNVRLVEATGEVVFADTMRITGDLKNATAENLRLRFANDARLAANAGRRVDGERLEFDRAVYSPCLECKDNPQRAPLWQIKAREVVHDKAKQDVLFYDATLEFFGVPVAYTPFFSHPDPSVKRRSGFLAPVVEHSGDLGFGLTAPYYWVIGDSQDITIYPRALSKRGLVMGGDYRQRFDAGSLRLQGSITKDAFHNEDLYGNVRGHIFGNARWDVNDTWRAGLDVERASDKRYLSFYEIGSSEFLTSRAYTEAFHRRSYASVYAYGFQEMRSNVAQRNAPYVTPIATYDMVGDTTSFGGHFLAQANARRLFRDSGTDSTRFSGKVGYDLPSISRSGHVFNLLATAQGDLYDVDNAVDPNTPGRTFNGTRARLFPQVSADWRYPMVRRAGDASYQTVEPIVGVTASPNVGREWRIPNEDAVDQIFDETNLFAPNRTTGWDRVDGGQRVNYGVKFGSYGALGGSSTLLIGQSARPKSDDSTSNAFGRSAHFSDYIGALSIYPNKYYDIFLRTRIDKDDPSNVRQFDALTAAGPREFRMFVGYATADAAISPVTTGFGDREEIRGGFVARPFENWLFGINAARDLERGAMRQFQAKLEYEDECFLFGIRLSRHYVYATDRRPDNRIAFRVVLKQTGDANY